MHCKESSAGRWLACLELWLSGQQGFKDVFEYQKYTYKMADEMGGLEFTIFDDSFVPIGYLYLLQSASWHRPTPGLDVSILVINKDHQSSRKVLEIARQTIVDVAERFDLKWYSRVKHVNSTTDIVITKEINRG